MKQKNVLELELARALHGFLSKSHVDLVDWITSASFVNTIDSFQGQEAEFVFVSLTRSKGSGLGFARDQRRANVMLSRSSQLMVVFGDYFNFVEQLSSKTNLITSLAVWSHQHDALFTVSNDTLTSFQPQENVRRAPMNVAPLKKLSSVLQNPKNFVTKSHGKMSKAEAAMFNTIRYIMKSSSVPVKLSMIGDRIPSLSRPESLRNVSLLSIIQKLPGFILYLEDNMWYVSNAPNPPKNQAVQKTPKVVGKAELARQTLFTKLATKILTELGGTASISELGNRILFSSI